MSDELDIDGIRAEHVASGDPADPHCAMCSDASYPIWPCDTAIVLERLGALEAERDAWQALAEDREARLQQAVRDTTTMTKAAHDRKKERDDLAARLAAAEAALLAFMALEWREERSMAGTLKPFCQYCGGTPTIHKNNPKTSRPDGHWLNGPYGRERFDGCPMAAAMDQARAALAGSREQAATTTTEGA